MKNCNIKRIIGITILCIMLFVILSMSWYLSSQNGTMSGAFTKRIAAKLVSFLYHHGELKIDRIISYNAWIEALNWMIRKFIHFIGYGFIGLLFCIILNKILKKKYWAAFLSLLFCTGWAVLDEYHQSFVAGRCSRWVDVGIDVAGAVIIIILVTFFLHAINRIKNSNCRLPK